MYYDDQAIADILRFARLALKFLGDLTYEELEASEKDQVLVFHELMMVGQACTRLSKKFREDHPQVNWRSWMDTRNAMVHAYDKVDLLEVWETVKFDLPSLIEEVEKMVSMEESRLA